jgi:hypothetical protein
MAEVDIHARQVKFRQPLFQVITQQWCAEQIERGVFVMVTLGLGPDTLPLARIAITAPKPHQRDEFNLLIVVHRIDECRYFLADRVIGMLLEHVDHFVVGRIGARIFICCYVFGVKLVRFEDNPTDLIETGLQVRLLVVWHVSAPLFIELPAAKAAMEKI